MKFDIRVVLKNLSRRFKFHYIMTRITGTVHEDQYIFLISHSVILRMRNISERSRRETQDTHFVFCNFFLEICAFMR